MDLWAEIYCGSSYFSSLKWNSFIFWAAKNVMLFKVGPVNCFKSLIWSWNTHQKVFFFYFSKLDWFSFRLIHSSILYVGFKRGSRIVPQLAKKRKLLRRQMKKFLSLLHISRSDYFHFYDVENRDYVRCLRTASLGIMGAPRVPPLCWETQSLGQQMLNAPFGINGLNWVSSKYWKGKLNTKVNLYRYIYRLTNIYFWNINLQSWLSIS